MGVTQMIGNELLEIIEWTDDSRDTLSFRFPDDDKSIKSGAQLIVRESQRAQLLLGGEFGDTFGPGRHRLVTENIPVLTRLRSWKYGFESPFKADVFFVTTRLFTGRTWGTSHPVLMRDAELGAVRVRAFGTYDLRIISPRLFLKEVAGTDARFTLESFDATMRSRVVGAFSDALASSGIPALDLAARQAEIGAMLLPAINPVVSDRYGIAVANFVVENVALPPDVETALDARAGMRAAGDLNDFVKFQMGQRLAKGGDGATAATELAMGMAVARELVKPPRTS